MSSVAYREGRFGQDGQDYLGIEINRFRRFAQRKGLDTQRETRSWLTILNTIGEQAVVNSEMQQALKTYQSGRTYKDGAFAPSPIRTSQAANIGLANKLNIFIFGLLESGSARQSCRRDSASDAELLGECLALFGADGEPQKFTPENAKRLHVSKLDLCLTPRNPPAPVPFPSAR